MVYTKQRDHYKYKYEIVFYSIDEKLYASGTMGNSKFLIAEKEILHKARQLWDPKYKTAIYLLLTPHDKRSKSSLYVGQSETVDSRLDRQMTRKFKYALIFTSQFLTDDNIRKEVETMLIQNLEKWIGWEIENKAKIAKSYEFNPDEISENDAQLIWNVISVSMKVIEELDPGWWEKPSGTKRTKKIERVSKIANSGRTNVAWQTIKPSLRCQSFEISVRSEPDPWIFLVPEGVENNKKRAFAAFRGSRVHFYYEQLPLGCKKSESNVLPKKTYERTSMKMTEQDRESIINHLKHSLYLVDN